MSKNVRTKPGVSLALNKTPKAEEPTQFFSLRPAWRLGRMEFCDPFGWHELDKSKLYEIQQRLAQLERLTWKEILISQAHWNHTIPIGSITKEARERLVALHLDDLDEVISLRLERKERMWGFRIDGALTLLWWDPTHNVWDDNA